jgi:glycosidase
VHHNALFFLLTEDGIPCIYYGTEQRFNGGNDPDNREDMWISGFGTNNGTFRYIQTLIQLRKQYAPLRRGDVRIVWSTTTGADGGTDDAGIFAFEREYNGQIVLVIINTNNNNQARPFNAGFQMTTNFAAGTRLVNVFCEEGAAGDWGAHVCSPQEQAQQAYVVGAGGALGDAVFVPPRSGLILVPE